MTSKETMAKELETVARTMRRYRLDSVEMPSGLKVLKTTHAPFVEASPSPDAVDEAATRRLEALGLVNATEDSGRVPVDQDEVMFAASRAPELDLESFRPTLEVVEAVDTAMARLAADQERRLFGEEPQSKDAEWHLEPDEQKF